MTAIIELEGVTKRYGHVVALDDLSLRVEQGQVHGFLGPNGAGKTTTMRVLLGLLGIASGRATVFGLDPWRDVSEIHSRLAYVPGDVTLWPNLSGGETLDILARLHGGGHDRQRWIDLFDLDPTKKNRTYSKGNRQKVALVAAFASDAELLILDEPTSGLDPLIDQAFVHAVQSDHARGKTILLSSHILGEVERLCDWVGIIRDGRLVDSAPLAELRGAGHTLITAHVDTQPDLSVDGVAVLASDGDRLRLSVTAAALPEALSRLSAAGLRSLEAGPPSLEDVFLSHYAATER
ncbi:ABC transporter ATP-binding protein [Tessaracoccus caeni]|uniref:ABC transporter ATP-binding protein n=1 Tax=Tessaracoccus caeni TaxID=3031239 RepID=UPI0023DC7C63|nr:ABC transporter ATP-binding protein [Tessaracoccus caeni]MDF1487172.1 ABC transporter ATP-binding protein [Tessaracoccus caeni]